MRTVRFGSEEWFALTGLVATFVVTAAWWALALWPVAAAPEWLVRTRYVCFGVTSSGLPDAGGWIGLIAGPIGMAAIVAIGWGRGFRNLIRAARTSRLVAAGSCLLLIVMMALVRVRSETEAETETGLPTGGAVAMNLEAPALDLVGHDGQSVRLDSFHGRVVLLTFAFAHCTTVCPLVVHDVLSAQKLVQQRGLAPVVLVVTLDPWRDTPSRLASIAREWQFPLTDAWMLGGSVDAVEKALADWRVPHKRDERNGDVAHPSLVYIIDARGKIAFASNGGAQTLAELTQRAGGIR